MTPVEDSDFSVTSDPEKPSTKRPEKPGKPKKLLWILLGTFAAVSTLLVITMVAFGPRLLPVVLQRIKPQLDGWIGEKLMQQTGWVVTYQDFQIQESGVELTGITGHEGQVVESSGLFPNRFEVQKISAEISLWPSVMAFEPRFQKIAIQGVKVDLAVAPEAAAHAAGKSATQTKQPVGDLALQSLRFFGSGAEISLSDVEFVQGRKYAFQQMGLKLQSSSQISISGREIRADLSELFPDQKTEFVVKDLSALASLSTKSVKLDPILITAPSLGSDLNLVLEIPFDSKTPLVWKLDWPSASLSQIEVWIPGGESLLGFKKWIHAAAPKGKGRVSLGSDAGGVSGQLDLKDASLSVSPDFPRIEDFSGPVEIHGSTVKVGPAQASVMGMALDSVSLAVSGVGAAGMSVKGSMGLDATPGRLLQFLKTGPFQETTEDWAEMAMPKKNLKGRITLAMPIKKGTGAQDVDLQFKVESFGMEVQGSEIDSFSGDVELAKGDLKVSNGKGTLSGLPFTVSGSRDSSGRGTFKVQGLLPLSMALPKKIRESFITGAGSGGGTAGSDANAGIPFQTEVVLAPLGSGAKMSFKGDADLSKLSWGGALSASKLDAVLKALPPVQFQAQHFSGAVQSVEFESAKVLEGKFKRGKVTSDLRLVVNLPEVVLDPLMDLDFSAMEDGGSGGSATGSAGDAAAAKSLPTLLDLSLTATRLDYQNQSFAGFEAQWKAASKSKATFKLKSDAFQGSGDFDSKQGLAGFVKADFAFIKLPRMIGAKVAQGSQEASTEDKVLQELAYAKLKDWKTVAFPSAQFRCKDFQVGEQKWGAIKLDSENQKTQYKFTTLAVEGPAVQMSMDEAWINHSPAKSHFKGKAQIRSKFRYRFEKIQAFQTLQLERSSLRFRLDFPGTPNRFKLAKAEASLTGWVRDGQFEGVKAKGSGLLGSIASDIAQDHTQMKDGIQTIYKFSFDIRVLEDQILVQFLRGLLGTVYFNLEGKSTISDEKLDLEAISRTHRKDIPDPELEEKGLLDVDPEEDPRLKGGLTFRHPITGTWSNPKFGFSPL